MSANFRQEVVERDETSESFTLETVVAVATPESVALAPMFAKANELMY